MVKMSLNDLKTELTEEELRELEEAEKKELKNAGETPVSSDADCPETTQEKPIPFSRVNP